MANRTVKDSVKDILDDNCEVIVTSSEFIPGRLYFVVIRTPLEPKYTQNSHYFTIDLELNYQPFLEDFGPLNLALLYRYCVKLNSKLKTQSWLGKKIVHYTTLKPKKRVNAAYLVGAYAIIYLNMHPDEVYIKLNKKDAPPFRDFRDASTGLAHYKISLLDCLNAIYKAHKHNFFNFEDFNVREYEHYEIVENGDLNWMVPNKFLAFASPRSQACINYTMVGTRTPEYYIQYFRKNNVTTIIRLNNKLYDAAQFTKRGFTHKDLFFVDGTTPSDDLVQKFLDISESTSGAVAVHCKAGLGRTGSMIACYLMKWYRFSAREAIAWLRICRPASIIGHQQEWLESKQAEMWALNSKLTPPKHEHGIYSLKYKAKTKVRTAGLRNTRSIGILPLDNVSRIANKVDSMTIDNQPKDENKNHEVLSDQDSNNSNAEDCSFCQDNLEQGDILNQIKAKRLARGLSPRVVRKSWSANGVNGTKHVVVVEKLNMTHPRRPLTRSKSSQGPPAKNIMNENRTAVASSPSVKVSVPVSLGMTLRSSNRLYSLRHPRTPETRLCKATSVR